MGEAADRLTAYIDTDDRYGIAHSDVHDLQVAAMNERFLERRAQIKLLDHRAKEAALAESSSHEDIAKVLSPHKAYKSYLEGWLSEQKRDRLGKWLDTVSTHRLPPQEVSAHQASTLGSIIWRCKNSLFNAPVALPVSPPCLLPPGGTWRVKKDAVASYTWGPGVKAANDRRIFGTGAVAHPRNTVGGQAYVDALPDPKAERYSPPIHPLTVGALTSMVVMRKKLADGTATPDEIAEMERTFI